MAHSQRLGTRKWWTKGVNRDAYDPSAYGDAFADVYDEWYDDLSDDDFVTHLSSLLPPHEARILELGAGTGRLIVKLQTIRQPRVDDFVALDASEAMLQRLRERNLAHVVHLHDDMCEFTVDGTFDLVFVGYNTIFNVPDAAGLLRCLCISARCLSTHGHLALDAVVPRGGEGEIVTVKMATPSHVVLSVSNHNTATQSIAGEFLEFEGDDCVRRRPWSVSYFTPSQIDDLAHEAGLELVERHGDTIGTPFTDESTRHVSVYRPIDHGRRQQ